MATYVSAKKARRMPEVMKKYRKGGANAFDKKIKTAQAYTRINPLATGVSRQNCQVDVSAVTLVPALRRNGKRVIF